MDFSSNKTYYINLFYHIKKEIAIPLFTIDKKSLMVYNNQVKNLNPTDERRDICFPKDLQSE
jgi:hypothetical protein